MQLIDQLREQLTDLEKFAYETGQGGLPSNELIAKQVIFKALLTCEEQLIDGVFAAVSRFKPKSLCVGVVVSWNCIIKSCGQWRVSPITLQLTVAWKNIIQAY